jgi:ATP-dependent Zn protease
VQQALERAVSLLTANRLALNDGAHRLVERETLSRDELPAVTPPPSSEKRE